MELLRKLDFKMVCSFKRRVEQEEQETANVLNCSNMKLNRFLQPVRRMSPGKITRICSLLGALVHTGKDEIKRWHNEENRKGERWWEGPKEKSVTNVETTPENNTVGVNGREAKLILMRITNPRHTPLLTL